MEKILNEMLALVLRHLSHSRPLERRSPQLLFRILNPLLAPFSSAANASNAAR